MHPPCGFYQSSRYFWDHLRPAATAGKPMVEVSANKAWATSAGVAPACTARRAWLTTAVSDRMAVAAPSWMRCNVFSSRGPLWRAALAIASKADMPQVAAEIANTLVGSFGLVTAAPLTALAGAALLGLRRPGRCPGPAGGNHSPQTP